MRVTTWTEYSLLIALHLAKRGNGGDPVAARELAELERLPGDYVEQILLRLRRAGLVESVRGARGGYFLAREPSAITVRDVMTASEHQTFEINCDSHPVDAERCHPDSNCSIRPVWRALQARVDDLLSSITLADLLKEQPAQDLVSLTSSAG
jgi:Rrf2 family transcriptional regulator, iron-sulfur cluster assembly transcription factor